MISQLFVQIYPFPACSPMVSYFAECYKKASAQTYGWDNVTEISRLAMAEPLAMATVA
jgi:hypothetical protein